MDVIEAPNRSRKSCGMKSRNLNGLRSGHTFRTSPRQKNRHNPLYEISPLSRRRASHAVQIRGLRCGDGRPGFVGGAGARETFRCPEEQRTTGVISLLRLAADGRWNMERASVSGAGRSPTNIAQIRDARDRRTSALRTGRWLTMQLARRGAIALTAGHNGPLTDLRAKRKFLRRIKLIWPVQSHSQKYFPSRLTQITSISLAVPSHMRGVSRSSRTWKRDAVDAAARLTKRADADGEVVWS